MTEQTVTWTSTAGTTWQVLRTTASGGGGGVPTSRTLTAGTGLSGGGDLTADRTFNVDFGTAAGTVAEGNDARLSDARTPTAHAASHGDGGSDEVSLDGSQVTSGTVGTARLGSGTADNTTYLRGDQTWQPVAAGGDTRKPVVTGTSGFGVWWHNGTPGVGPITIAKGELWLGRAAPLVGTVSYVVAMPITAGTAGDVVYVVAYTCGANGLPTGAPVLSQSVTTGISTSPIEQAITAMSVPDEPLWVGVHVSSSNASASFQWQGYGSPYGDPGVARWVQTTYGVMKATSQGATPKDVTGYTLGVSPGATTFAVQPNGALVGVR